MHGDSIAGGGSSMSISKAVSNLRGALQYKNNLNTELGVDRQELNHFDSVFMGHFHRVDEMDIGTGELHICGCIKGVDEFALQRLHVSAKPKQIATYWHPLHGYLGKEIIYLSRWNQMAFFTIIIYHSNIFFITSIRFNFKKKILYT